MEKDSQKELLEKKKKPDGRYCFFLFLETSSGSPITYNRQKQTKTYHKNQKSSKNKNKTTWCAK